MTQSEKLADEVIEKFCNREYWKYRGGTMNERHFEELRALIVEALEKANNTQANISITDDVDYSAT